MDVERMSREELLRLLGQQHKFTEALRTAAAQAMAHLGHAVANYTGDRIPDDKLRDLAHARVAYDILSIQPSPIMRRREH